MIIRFVFFKEDLQLLSIMFKVIDVTTIETTAQDRKFLRFKDRRFRGTNYKT